MAIYNYRNFYIEHIPFKTESGSRYFLCAKDLSEGDKVYTVLPLPDEKIAEWTSGILVRKRFRMDGCLVSFPKKKNPARCSLSHLVKIIGEMDPKTPYLEPGHEIDFSELSFNQYSMQFKTGSRSLERYLAKKKYIYSHKFIHQVSGYDEYLFVEGDCIQYIPENLEGGNAEYYF